VARGDLRPSEHEGVFICKKFKTPEEAVQQASVIDERLGVRAASEAWSAHADARLSRDPLRSHDHRPERHAARPHPRLVRPA
jgi:hypothetical protein